MGKRIECTLPNHTGEWIERTNEIEIGWWNRWRVADHTATQKMICEVLTDWNLVGANGKPAPKPSEGMTALDALDVKFLGWLISTITKSVVEDMTLSPNESEPSPD